MDVNKPESELTTTIHLGHLGKSAEPSDAEELPVTENLALLSDEEREVVALLAAEDAMLIAHRGPGKGSRYLLSGSETETRLGRAPESEIFLDDVTVSRKHAAVYSVAQEFVLRDLGSLNGTYVNGDPSVEAVLKSGDEIQIGKFHMIFFGGSK